MFTISKKETYVHSLRRIKAKKNTIKGFIIETPKGNFSIHADTSDPHDSPNIFIEFYPNGSSVPMLLSTTQYLEGEGKLVTDVYESSSSFEPEITIFHKM